MKLEVGPTVVLVCSQSGFLMDLSEFERALPPDQWNVVNEAAVPVVDTRGSDSQFWTRYRQQILKRTVHGHHLCDNSAWTNHSKSKRRN